MNHLMFEVTDQEFGAQVLGSDQPVLVKFTADWCPPCKMIAPIVEDIARKYEGKLRVGVMDNDVHPQAGRQYGVMGLPTLILFVYGEPVERIVGFTAKDRIEAKLLPHLTAESA